MKVPTLNLEPDNELIPRNGVYVSRISLEAGPLMDAVTNIGTRPTFNETGTTIETFVIADKVPENVNKARLSFLYRLRDERKFDSPDALRQQIGVDTQRAAKFFRRLRHHEQIHSN
jgi:riboflavin kinase/FMN adenylyltransferase